MVMALSELKNGEKGRVVKILGGYGIRNKLDSLGVRLGVELVKKSSFSGRGPVVMQVGMTELAIGGRMAERIMVDV